MQRTRCSLRDSRRAFARFVPVVVVALPVGTAMLISGARAFQDGGTRGLPEVPVPTENPITEEKRVLGKMLFWDEQLSSDASIACGTCHIPRVGGGDPRTAIHPGADGLFETEDDVVGSPGVVSADARDEFEPDESFGLRPQVTGRYAPSAILAMYPDELFVDGRAGSEFLDPETGEVAIVAGGALENQAVGPPMSDVEMAHEQFDWASIRTRLTAARPLALATDLPDDLALTLADDPTYPELFEAAFGDDDITAKRIAFAIATYERTLVPDQTPLERYLGGDDGAMTPRQADGFNLFLGSACAMCHTFPLFTDNQFRNIGVRPVAEDIGRQEVTGDPFDAGKFRTSTLINSGLRNRFMHNGGLATMQEVMDFYAHRNGFVPFDDNLDALFQAPIVFDPAQEAAVVDFIVNALTDARVANETFPFDRPLLHSQQPVPNPLNLGGGIPGSGGRPPAIIANRPPYLGNKWFQVGLDLALADSNAWLAISETPPVDGEIVADELLGPVTTLGEGVRGYGTGAYPIALDPSLAGEVLYLQWVVDDPVAPGGQAKSSVVEVTLFCGNGECVCIADFNRDRTTDTRDVLAFLNAWSEGDLKADTDRDGAVNTIDLIGFLNHWNDGC